MNKNGILDRCRSLSYKWMDGNLWVGWNIEQRKLLIKYYSTSLFDVQVELNKLKRQSQWVDLLGAGGGICTHGQCAAEPGCDLQKLTFFWGVLEDNTCTLFLLDNTCTRGRRQHLFWCSTWRSLHPSCNSWQTSASPAFHSPWHRCLHPGSPWGCGRSCSPSASTWSRRRPAGPWGTPWGSKVACLVSNLATSNACSCISVQSLTHWCWSKQQVIIPGKFCHARIYVSPGFYFKHLRIFLQTGHETSIVTIQKFPWALDSCKVAQPLNLKGNFEKIEKEEEKASSLVLRDSSCRYGRHEPCPWSSDCCNLNWKWPSPRHTAGFHDLPPSPGHQDGSQSPRCDTLHLIFQLRNSLLLGAVLLMVKIFTPVVIIPPGLCLILIYTSHYNLCISLHTVCNTFQLLDVDFTLKF